MKTISILLTLLFAIALFSCVREKEPDLVQKRIKVLGKVNTISILKGNEATLLSKGDTVMVSKFRYGFYVMADSKLATKELKLAVIQ